VRGRFTTKTVNPMGRSNRGSYFFRTARKMKVHPTSHITTWPKERFEKPVWENNDTISVMMGAELELLVLRKNPQISLVRIYA
jgi:hypothetical protein